MTTSLTKQNVTETYLNPEGLKYEEIFIKKDGNEIFIFDENQITEVERYGRLFILFDLLPKEAH